MSTSRATWRRPLRSSSAVALTAATLGACGGASDTASKLEELGFFKYARPSARAAAVKEVRSDRDAVFGVEVGRLFHADEESLTEGGADDFLRDIAPALRRMGVTKLRVADKEFTDRYVIAVNGEAKVIFSRAEGRREDVWGYAGARTVAIINELLAEAGSEERAYALYGGNDFHVFLLTPELRDVIASFSGKRDEPYEITDRPPNFGQPRFD
jgi:hypothetical protein